MDAFLLPKKPKRPCLLHPTSTSDNSAQSPLPHPGHRSVVDTITEQKQGIHGNPHPPQLLHQNQQHQGIHGNHHLQSHHNAQQQQQDVVILVGDRRRPYTIAAQTLARGSDYFRKLLLSPPPSSSPLLFTVDCEEAIFESLLTLLRYSTYRALPQNLPQSHLFKLQREVQFYGISVSDSIADEPSLPRSSPAKFRGHHSNTSTSSSTLSVSLSSSPCSSPILSSAAVGGKFCRSDLQPPCDLTVELPDLVAELMEPARLILVSCIDPSRAAFFSCKHCSSHHNGNSKITSSEVRSSIRSSGCANSPVATQWALNFHHKHAFCTTCGSPPRAMAPRHFAELFMAAASYFSDDDDATSSPSSPSWKWQVSADSTCTLKFLQHPAMPCSCCIQTVARTVDQEDDRQYGVSVHRSNRTMNATSVWAANCFYSHAFCTRCGHCAEGPVLSSLLLTLRYGGGSRKKHLSRSSTSSSRSST